ncbi:hypothetical protein FUAX_17370 [Fulvitalea axinellae]|uniref:Nucleotidyltransferase domain-containing protein n=2 Tax=Fulvitalea axinellae TaxID=1182444 RepID=A0AAU9CJ24_9BACT|nr:hypothetical protein FUAX_17370 [Fulvitalea axinellae]
MDHVRRIEKENGVKALWVCETGSRAWGFPSPDSDYDVRMIYTRPKNDYLTVWESKDTIEYMSDDRELDISGWDLRKAMGLLWKSNASMFERLSSTVIYDWADSEIIDALNNLSQQYFSPKAALHHYLNMGIKAFANVQGKKYRLKRLFYALRAALCCRWILEYQTAPPMRIQALLDILDINADLKERILSLIELKSGKGEAYEHQGEREVFTFIDSTFEYTKASEKRIPANKGDVKALNQFFQDTLNRLEGRSL